MTERKGYKFPDPIDPGEYECIQVYIPKHSWYLGEFWLAYEHFTKWSAWERDDAHTGKDVAALWLVGFNMARENYEAGEACLSYQLRQNEDDPCLLEQSFDGGETWSLAFDYHLCSTVITVPAPYPGSETGASDAAAAAVKNIFQGLLNISDDICSMSRTEYINAATTYMRAFDSSYANPIALGAIWDAYCEMSEEEQDFAKSDCPFDEHKSDLENCANPDGLFDWLNCLSDQLIDWLNTASTDLMNALNAAAAALSGNGWQLASQGGDGGGAGFGDICGTYIWTWDATQLPLTYRDGTTTGAGGNPGNCALGHEFPSGGGAYLQRCDVLYEFTEDLTITGWQFDSRGPASRAGYNFDVTIYDGTDIGSSSVVYYSGNLSEGTGGVWFTNDASGLSVNVHSGYSIRFTCGDYSGSEIGGGIGLEYRIDNMSFSVA